MSARNLVASNWREQAECLDDPDLWFEDKHADEAKFICAAACRVQAECLVSALANGETSGIWAGHSATELAEMPGFVRAASANDFVPEPDDARLARFARIEAKKRKTAAVTDPLADLDHPDDRKTTKP